ncbi:hypothetical protein [Novosphingobium sp. YAF33]|uniref:hypothetical protein n=1 Tax=Novosphingobium sp. YAF33 TaxID=3233082 RepID=UPI003F9E5ACD
MKLLVLSIGHCVERIARMKAQPSAESAAKRILFGEHHRLSGHIILPPGYA